MKKKSLLPIGSLLRIFRPAVAFATLALSAILEPVSGPMVYAQPPAAEPTIILPSFASASIKLSNVHPARRKSGIFATPDGGVRAEGLTLGALMWYAFDVQPYQIAGGPSWIHKDLFDVVAVPPVAVQAASANSSTATNPLSDQQRLMLQSLLITRFQLSFHRNYKPGQVYVLMRPRVRSRLRAPKDPSATPWLGSNVGTNINGDGLMAKNISMPLLAARLNRYLQCPVEDKTELKDSYDFKFVYSDNNPNTEEALVKSIVTSVEGVGLMLGPSTGLVSTIVVDSAEKPPAN
jgi:uncharacterized protein (TIGR03435 family)